MVRRLAFPLQDADLLGDRIPPGLKVLKLDLCRAPTAVELQSWFALVRELVRASRAS